MLVLIEKQFRKDTFGMRKGDRFREYMNFTDMREASAYRDTINKSLSVPYRITMLRRA